MRKAIPTVLAGMLIVAFAAAGNVTMAEETSEDVQGIVGQMLMERHGELGDTMQIRINGGEYMVLPTEEALGMFLDAQPGAHVPVSAPQAGLATGPTPSTCHPAIIVSVFAFGGYAADAEVNGAPAGGAACAGLPQVGPTATGSVELVNPGGAFVKCAIANSAPGWIPGGHSPNNWKCAGWTTVDLTTTNCAILIEAITFFGEYIQQLGAGMPGCAGPNPTAAGTIF